MKPAFEGGDDSVTTPALWRAHDAWGAAASLSSSDVIGQLRQRLVVVAAHPDDETLGAAGLMALAHRAGRDVRLVLATAGEASHPESPTHPPEQLAQRRLEESARALRVVAPQASTVFLALGDGHVAEHQDAISARLVALIGDGRDCTVVSPWRGDGHPDHEAVARAAQVAAQRTGADHWEFPIWFWHWATPESTPWDDLVHLQLDAPSRQAKLRAVACHSSQVADLSDQPGDETLLTADFLDHFSGETETFFRSEGEDQAFEELHQESSDPWGTERDWFEQRKRDVVLALLPRPRFRHAFELGCSTGSLARALAPRCDRLTAVDSSPTALGLAARHQADAEDAAGAGGRARVDFELRNVPAEWPAGEPDLIVISEFAYFLNAGELELLNHRISQSAAEDGTIVVCNWRHSIEGWPLDGPRVHAYFRQHARWRESAHYLDDDFEVSLFCAAETMPEPRT